MRDATRRQRYNAKLQSRIEMPVSIATINFIHEVNIAYVIRAAVCFGARNVIIIGDIPDRHTINELSGSMLDYASIIKFPNTHEFLEHCRAKSIKLISAELPEHCEDGMSLFDYRFDFNNEYCIVVGNECYGIPPEIIKHSQLLYVPMPGVGFCLNTAQTANVIAYECSKQYAEWRNNNGIYGSK